MHYRLNGKSIRALFSANESSRDEGDKTDFPIGDRLSTRPESVNQDKETWLILGLTHVATGYGVTGMQDNGSHRSTPRGGEREAAADTGRAARSFDTPFRSKFPHLIVRAEIERKKKGKI